METYLTQTVGTYTVSDDPSRLDIHAARFISDYATFAYVCDVYVLEEHRGHGLSKAMMAMASSHPRLQGLRRWTLVTNDAHGLYAQFGFKPLATPERFMERAVPGIYKRK
jgi:GNAT superfamily N-acetyltransferase